MIKAKQKWPHIENKKNENFKTDKAKLLVFQVSQRSSNCVIRGLHCTHQIIELCKFLCVYLTGYLYIDVSLLYMVVCKMQVLSGGEKKERFLNMMLNLSMFLYDIKICFSSKETDVE